MTYDELLALPATWNARSDAVSSAPTFVALAEGKMTVLRTRQMVAREPITLDAEFVALPDDYLDHRSLVTPDFEVDYVTPERMDQIVTDDPELLDTGDGPGAYTVVGNEIRLWPIPVGSYTGELTYYRRIPTLSAAENWVNAEDPNAYVFGVLWACAMWRKDPDDTILYQGQFDAALNGLQARFGDRIGKSLRADPMMMQTTRRRYGWR